MAKIHAHADFQESHCPACGATINAGPKSRKRKVQCPKCREIVELGKPETVAKVLPDTDSARLAELEARLARLEALEARVAALESAGSTAAIVPFPDPAPAQTELPLVAEFPVVETVPLAEATPSAEASSPVETSAPPGEGISPTKETPLPAETPPVNVLPAETNSPGPSSPLPVENSLSAPAPSPWEDPPSEEPPPARQLRWIERSERHRVEHIPAEVEEALCYNLTTVAAHEITIRAVQENPIEWQRALQLKGIFLRANWQVTGPQPTNVRLAEHDLLLAVGSLPPSAEAAGIYLALTAAGFSLDSVLDPKLDPGQAALVVG